MNTYIKQLVESFFDDIENDIEDTDNTLYDSNINQLINISINNIKDLIPRTAIQEIHDITYDIYHNICKFKLSSIWSNIIIFRTDTELYNLLEIFKELKNIGCKKIIFCDNSENETPYIILISSETMLKFDFYNIILSNIILENIDIINFKSEDYENNDISFLYCNINKSISVISRRLYITNCTNIHDFSFIKNVITLHILIQSQKYMSKTNNFKGLPENITNIFIKFGTVPRTEQMLRSHKDNDYTFNKQITCEYIKSLNFTIYIDAISSNLLSNIVPYISLKGLDSETFETLNYNIYNLTKNILLFIGDLIVTTKFNQFKLTKPYKKYMVKNNIYVINCKKK